MPKFLQCKRYVRNLVVSPIRAWLRLWWRSGLGTLGLRNDRRRVLLCPSDELMADYLGMIAVLLRDDPRISMQLTAPRRRLLNDCFGRDTAAELGMPYINYVRARMKRWDLILFADLAAADRFDAASPKVLFYHSISGGKIIGGGQYRYGSSAMRGEQPKFSRMFESSHQMRDHAVNVNPKLADVVCDGGDLRWDRALGLQNKRDDIRRTMGFEPEDTVVLIQSTWRGDSLLETMGEALIEQAARLTHQSRYRFIFSTHPRHWYGTYARDHPWGECLLQQKRPGFFIAEPSFPWERLHTASDLAVTDHTGLCVAYALQNKPMIFIPIREGVVAPHSYENRLYEISPHLPKPQELETLLQHIAVDYPMDKLQQIALEINAYPNESEQRIRTQLYKLLRLAPLKTME